MKIGRSISTAIASHSVLDTGVHGVGVSTVSSVARLTTDITNHRNLITGIHGVHVKRKASDESLTNDDTLQNDDDLVLPVGATEVWIIDLVLIALEEGLGGNPGIKYLFTVPSGGTASILDTFNPSSSDAFVDATSQLTFDTDPTEKYIRALLLYRGGGTPGNLQLQWAQLSAQNEYSTMLTNSFMLCKRLV